MGRLFVLEIRNLKKDEREMAIKLSNITFRDQEQISMGKAFPFIFEEGHICQSIGAFENGELVSFMGLVPSTIKIGPARLFVYSLGSVFTMKEHMGKGIATKLLEQVYAFLEKTEASLLLVSGTRSLYTRNGCHRFGDVRRYFLKRDKEMTFESSNYTIREVLPSDLMSMSRIDEQRYANYIRSSTDLATLLSAEAYASCLKCSHKVLVAEKNNSIVGYLVIGVPYHEGITRKPFVIEWSGSAIVCNELLKASLDIYEIDELEVPVPHHEKELIQLLTPYQYKEEKNQGTVRIHNTDRLMHQLLPYVKQSSEELNFSVITRSTNQFEVKVGNKGSVLTSSQLIEFLFDPSTSYEELRRSMKNELPLPFPYTAGLNYV